MNHAVESVLQRDSRRPAQVFPGQADVGAALERIMVDSMRAWIPDVAIRVDVVAAERWTKRAKRVTNAQGLLEVWCG